MDGAQLRQVFEAKMLFDRAAGLRAAQERFGQDLASGKLWNVLLLDDIPEIFRFLEIDWPSEAVLSVIEEHVDNVLAVSRDVPNFESLTVGEKAFTAEGAICQFLMYLLAFPAEDVSIGARRTIARFVREYPNAPAFSLSERGICNDVQIEHLLAAIETGLKGRRAELESSRSTIEQLELA